MLTYNKFLNSVETSRQLIIRMKNFLFLHFYNSNICILLARHYAHRLYIKAQNIKKEHWKADENGVKTPVRGQVTKHYSPHRY